MLQNCKITCGRLEQREFSVLSLVVVWLEVFLDFFFKSEHCWFSFLLSNIPLSHPESFLNESAL